MADFEAAAERVHFPQEEEKIAALWVELDAFQESMRQSKAAGRPTFTFYDGPPFATGLPHYGHILASTIKDVVTRYAHQTGHHVDRRFGWDCECRPRCFCCDIPEPPLYSRARQGGVAEA